MCIAVPGRVVSLEGNYANVDFKGNIVRVNVHIIEPKAGDYVLVHAGCAIEILSRDMALELAELFEELEEYGRR